MHAAGGLVTTAQDLSRWLEVNLNEGRLCGQQIIPPEVLADVHRPQAEQQDAFGPFDHDSQRVESLDLAVYAVLALASKNDADTGLGVSMRRQFGIRGIGHFVQPDRINIHKPNSSPEQDFGDQFRHRWGLFARSVALFGNW